MGVDDEVLPEDRDDRDERPEPEDPVARALRDGKALPPVPPAILARVPPHDEAAEEALLSALLHDPTRVREVANVVAADDFYLTKNRRLYEVCLELHHAGRPADAHLVKREIAVRHLVEEIGGPDRLVYLVEVQGSPAMATAYAKAVAECSAKREEIRIGTDMVREAFNGSASMAIAEHSIEQIVRVRDMYADRRADRVFKILKPDKDGDQVDWLVRGYVARGSGTLLSALPKAGKTTLTYAVVRALQQGDAEFCGLACPEPCDTIVMTEEPKSAVLETWKALGVDPERVYAMTREDAFPMRPLAENVDLLLKAAKPRKHKIGLVIVDTWRFWANLPPKAQNDAGAVQAAYRELQRIPAEGYALMLLHHLNKTGGEDGIGIADSIALLASVDISIEMGRFGRSEKPTMRLLKAMGRHQRIPAELVVDYRPAAEGQHGSWVALGEADKARDTLKEHRVLRALVEINAWSTVDEVCAHMKEKTGRGMKDDAARPLLNALYERHEVQRTGKGVPKVPFLYASLAVPLHQQPPPATPPA